MRRVASTPAAPDPVALLVDLIRHDTRNPPGNEAGLIGDAARLLRASGVEEIEVVEPAPGRANLVARLRGGGSAAPLLVFGHVDVASAAPEGEWTHPPFEGVRAGGHVWGRGALDMKGGVAMALAAFLRAKVEETRLAGDVVLALVCDEEAGGTLGAKYLVEERPELFDGVRYAIGEFGGFTLELAGHRIYPIQVAEKGVARLRVRVVGAPGHGAVGARRGGALARAGRLLEVLGRRRLPVHVTPAAVAMAAGIAGALPAGRAVRGLLGSGSLGALERALGLVPRSLGLGEMADALLRNTVTAKAARAGDERNPFEAPREAVLEVDGRLLPGQGPEDLVEEIRRLAGRDLAQHVDFEVLRHEPGRLGPPDMGLFGVLGTILREADPEGVPVPALSAGATDGRHFAKLGIQSYGFLPTSTTPLNRRILGTIHAPDERIPVSTVTFGADALHEVFRRFGEAE